MSIPDNLIVKYFIALTDVPMSEIEAMEKDIASGTMNPRDAKMALGERIAAAYHGEDEARQARERFVKVFSQREMPNEMQEFAIQDLPLTIVDVLVQAGLAASKSEARRLIEQGAVEIDGKEIRDLREAISSRDGQVIKVGKRRFLKIKSE